MGVFERRKKKDWMLKLNCYLKNKWKILVVFTTEKLLILIESNLCVLLM